MKFLKDFKKAVSKIETVSVNFAPPRTWYSTGNYAINKILSGSYMKGVPESRVTILAGPSGSGKSFVACNIMREAQKAGAFILVLDSENALDPVFMSKIGIDCDEEKLAYVQVSLISDVTAVLSEFISGYEKEHGRDNPDAPPVFIVLDSFDMLLTDAESAHFDAGQQRGDQGQRAKQIH